MRHTLLFALLFLSITGFAQNSATDFKYALKLSNLSSLTISRVRDTQGNRIGGTYLRMFQPIPSFTYKTRKGNFNEIGLNHIAANRRMGGSQIYPQSNFGLSVGLMKHFVFLKTKETQWVPSLGIGLSPTYTLQLLDPTQNVAMVKSSQQLAVELLVTPRITWYSKGKFFMDFGMPVSLASAHLINHGIQPINSTTGTSRTLTNFNLLNPQILAQIGFGIKH